MLNPKAILGRMRALRHRRGLMDPARSFLLGTVAVALVAPALAVADSQQTFADQRLGEHGNYPVRLTPNLVASEWTCFGQTSEVKVANGRVELRGWVAGTGLDKGQYAEIRLTPDEGWALDRFQLSWKCLGLQAEKDRPRIAFAEVWACVGTNAEPAATFGVYRTPRNQPVSQNWSTPLAAAPGEPVALRFFAWGAEPLDGSSHLVLDDLRIGGTVAASGGHSPVGPLAQVLAGGGSVSSVLGFISVEVFTAVVVLTVLITVWLLVLVLRRSSIMASRQNEIIRALSEAESRSSVGREDLAAVVTTVVEQATARLSSALGRIEKRMRELVQSARSALAELAEQRAANRRVERPDAGRPDISQPTSTGVKPVESAAAATSNRARFETLLGKGQALLGLGKPEPALVCFEEALRLQPQNTEAILKAGQALEILQRLDEAMRCYDRAVRLDRSLAIAWLHKGRICNRLDRHEEALECYERAGKVGSHDYEQVGSAHGA